MIEFLIGVGVGGLLTGGLIAIGIRFEGRTVAFSTRPPVSSVCEPEICEEDDEPFTRRRLGRHARAACVMVVSLLLGACAHAVVSDVGDLATDAQTPAEHAAVAAAYRDRAERSRREAVHHARLAHQWSAGGGARVVTLTSERSLAEGARHCRELSRALSDAAEKAEALAAFHEGLAKGGEVPARTSARGGTSMSAQGGGAGSDTATTNGLAGPGE